MKVSGIDEKDYTIEQSGNGWILKSKGDYAYAIIDCDDPATEQLVSKLQAVEGVIKVRVIK